MIHIRMNYTFLPNKFKSISIGGRGQSWKISFELITSTRLGLEVLESTPNSTNSCQCVGHILIYSTLRVQYSNFDRRLQLSKNIFGLKCSSNHLGPMKNELLLIVVKSEVKQISRVFFKLHTLQFPFVVCHCVPQFWQRIAFSHIFPL